MTTDRTNTTITLKDRQVRSKPDSCNPEGGHALHILLCYCNVQYHDDLYGIFDYESEGFH